jgi:hypothetical protein
MSLLTVVNDVCRVVGVHEMTSVVNNTRDPRTGTEMLSLANEMAQRIAWNTREWGRLKTLFTADAGMADNTAPGRSAFYLPANFQRFLLNSNLYRTSMPMRPLRFIPDQNDWLQRRLRGFADPRGEWTLIDGSYIAVAPQLFDLNTLPAWANNTQYAVGTRARDVAAATFWVNNVAHVSAAAGTFVAERTAHPTWWTELFQESVAILYLNKNSIQLDAAGSSESDSFLHDGDVYVLNERLLKLGMVWQWKANKGTPYSEDLNSYNDALDRAAGSDVPMPVMIGRRTISAAAGASYPFPIDPGMVPL